MDVIREAETVRGGLLRRLARRGSASPRRGRGSVLVSSGTLSGADGTRLKTLSFGPETGKTTVPLAAEVAHVWKVRPDLNAISATRRRRKRRPRFLSASSGSSRRHRRCMRYASLKAKGYTLRRRRSCEQDAGQSAHEAGRHALERRRKPERVHLQGVVGPLRRHVGGDDRPARTTA